MDGHLQHILFCLPYCKATIQTKMFFFLQKFPISNYHAIENELMIIISKEGLNNL